jgi:hypothetical protein
VIQLISPIGSLPSAISSPSVLAVQGASSPSQVDVATGSLPEPTAADASAFRDATAAGGVEANKIQEVDMQRLAPANQVWSHAGKSLSESMNGMSRLEASVNQSLRDYQKPSASKFADGSDRSGEKPSPDGPNSSSSSGSSALLDQLSDNMRKTFEESLRMVQFTITVDLMSKSSSDTIGSVKQLANGGGGG